MSKIDDVIAKSVHANDVPFLVAMVGNKDGVLWSGSSGDRSPGKKATQDTVFRIFSMTKAVGATAAMILMERGKLDLNAPVDSILPEFKEIKVLEGFDGSTPRLRAPRKKLTVRHLATHTSGFVYEFWNTELPKYMQATGLPSIASGLDASFFYPLAFEPGERWDYGIGIDWLGRVVEAVAGRKIDQFCRQEILEPLGMVDTCFEVDDRIRDRLSSLSIRGEDGKFSDFAFAPPPHPNYYGMGHALYSTAPDYLRFLRMFLNKGQLDGARILSEKSVQSMLANHIGDLTVGRMKTVAPPITADVEFFPGRKKTHSLGFMRLEEDIPGARSAGSQFWAGVLNTHYWFDPSKGIAAVFMTQSLPFVESRFLNVYDQFERAVYDEFVNKQAKPSAA